MIVAFAIAVAVDVAIAFGVAVAIAVAVAAAIANRSYIRFTKSSALDLAFALLASELRAYKLTTFAIVNAKN